MSDGGHGSHVAGHKVWEWILRLLGFKGDPQTVTVKLFAGEPREGIWCSGCKTWARFEVDALTIDETGVTRAGTVEGCDRCASEGGV